MKKKYIGIVIAILIVSLFVYLGVRGNKPAKIQVKTGKATIGDIKSYLSTTGVVKSKVKDEYFGQPLKVASINFKIGDTVKVGDVLLTYDISDLDLAVKTQTLQYDNAVLSRNELYNNNKLINEKINDIDKQIIDLQNKLKGITDPITIESIKKSISSLEANKASIVKISPERLKQVDNSVSLAKLSLDSSKDKLNKAMGGIKAKNAGTITSFNAKVDTNLNSVTPAFILQDLSSLYVELAVSKYDANNIKIGQECSIKLRDSKYSGKVINIKPAATSTLGATGNTVNLGVDVDILEKAPDLKVDFDVDVDILINQSLNTIKIPGESIVTDKDGNITVFLYENGKAVMKKIVAGVQSDTEVEVKEGIKENQEVILNPSANIEDGIEVSILIGDGK